VSQPVSLPLQTPLSEETVRQLRAGQQVLLSGQAYVGRDSAHKRMIEALEAGKDLPFDPAGQVIYYAGPTPARPGKVVGSFGPTTSYRMDPYVQPLLELGLKGMIGKGVREAAVGQALQKFGAVYFAATGGAGALLASCIVASKVIAYPELGPEALRQIELRDFPVFVAGDTVGGDIYASGQAAWQQQ
jgi:fumarate hydratase subunit beta